MKTNKTLRTIGSVVLTVLLFLLIMFIAIIPEELFSELFKSSTSPVVKTAVLYGENVFVWICFIVYCLINKKDRDMLAMMGTKPAGNRPLAILIGLAVGAGSNLLIAAGALLTGSIRLQFTQFNLGAVLLLFVCVLLQSGSEELLCRDFLYVRLRKIFPNVPAVAVLGNVLVFAALHLGNTGMGVLPFACLILVAVQYSLTVYYFDSLWAPIMMHTAWNFTQSIVLGLPNSGMTVDYTVLSLSGEASNGVAYNTMFGLEGTVAACVVIGACCVLTWWIGSRRKAKH